MNLSKQKLLQIIREEIASISEQEQERREKSESFNRTRLEQMGMEEIEEYLSEDNLDEKKKKKKKKDWIQKAVDPEHKGYCTPMTKSTCTPKRKALAKRFKKAGRKEKKEGGTGWQGKV